MLVFVVCKSAQHSSGDIARLLTCTASTRQNRNLMALLECGELCHALCVHLRCLSKTEGWTVG